MADSKRQITGGLALLLALLALPCLAETPVPRDTVPAPDDHLAWFGLRGPVKEMVEYDYNNYGKTIWRFDTQGRLTEYIEYTNPFFESGGCVFGLWAHYRYAYDEKGQIQFLETYNADYNTVDDFADLTLELFPPQCKDADFRGKAEKEYGDTTRCYSEYHQKGETEEYFGIRYDRYGNWFEQVHTTGDDYSCASIRVHEITYYKDIDLFDLPVGVKAVMHRRTADNRVWSNRYDFDRDGYMTRFRSWADDEMLYEWTPADDEPGSDLIAPESANDTARTVEYWSSVPVGELKTLPAEINEKDAFYLCFDYMGYAFEGSLYPLHNGWWVVLNHWCLDEMDGIYLGEDESGEPIPAASQYKDPFAGMRYPIIRTDSVSFSTRNYSNQTIKLYKRSKGKMVADRLPVQCSMDVLDADPETRRVLCRTNPNDWMWGEPQSEEEIGYKHPFISVIGWMDEEWICANLLTTCP